MTCHILATVLNHELLAASLLVFKSLRVGFPTSQIHVYGNGLDRTARQRIARAAIAVGARFQPIDQTSHGQWIEWLIRHGREPFWIADCDIEFYRQVEHWFDRAPDGQLFAGRYEPEFFEDWTRSTHVARLHPSLMWFNPRPLRAAMRSWPGKHPFFNSVEKTLIRWSFVPAQGRLLFYDTCAGLHHALKGTPFTPEQNECFHHTFAGTYSDLLGATDAESNDHEEFCKRSMPPNWS